MKNLALLDAECDAVLIGNLVPSKRATGENVAIGCTYLDRPSPALAEFDKWQIRASPRALGHARIRRPRKP
jgi:hypothetical protein